MLITLRAAGLIITSQMLADDTQRKATSLFPQYNHLSHEYNQEIMQ